MPWQEAAQQQSRHRFDLQRGFLFRVVWVRERGGAGGHLIVCSHHAIVDGTSLMRLLHQILVATVAVQQELERGAASAEAAAARLPAVKALPLPPSIHSHLRLRLVGRALAWVGRHLAVRDQRRFTRAPWLPLAPAAMQPRSRHDIATLCAFASGDSARWAVLSAACKKRGATVGGAFAAAVQFAVCRHLAAHGMSPPMAGGRVAVPLSMDFNMRIRIDHGEIDAQAIGLGTSIANVGVPVDPDIDFWSLARLLTRSARRQLRLGTPKLFQAVTDTVVDYHGLWRRRGVDHGRTGGVGDGVNISNVGRYPFPHTVGPLRLRDVHGFNGACVGGPMFIFWLRHVDAHLCYNAIAAHPAVDRPVLDAVFADVVDLMERLAPAAAERGLTLAAHAKAPVGAVRRPVRDAADIDAIEATPLASRVAVGSAYEALLQAAAKVPSKEAIRFFIDGHCHDPRRIPWRHRLRSAVAGLRYGRGAAKPFETFTFEEAARRVAQTARLFQACGVGRNDVVSLLLPNLPETLFCLWAAETVGIANPVNPLLDGEIVASILAAAGTRVLVTLGDLPGSALWSQVERIRRCVPTLQAVIIVRGRGSPDVIRYHDALARLDASPLPRAAWPAPQDAASLFHTGGTTGLPKLVRGTHANKIANAHMLVLASPLSSDDVGLVALPLFHANAAVNTLVALLLGMTTVLAGPAGFRTKGVRERFLKILAGHRISYFSAVPSMFASLLQLPPERADLLSVRFAISAAAALPPAVAQAFTARTGIPILEGYGQTEATVASCLTPWAGRGKAGSAGLRLPYVRLKTALLGDANRFVRDCATDEIGHLLVAGEHVACGYLDADHDRALWVHDDHGRRWLHSGDLARIDADGYVWLTGRAKELIIRGGHNIDPRMIEEALQSHPAVVMAAAVGRPDAMAGELPVAYVTLAAGSGLTADELALHAQCRIPERRAWPKAVRIVDELPLTAIGKVFKPALVRRESENAFEAAIAPALAGLGSASVAVQPDARHGLLADIRVRLRRPGDRAAAQATIEAAMGPFAARHVVTFPLES